MWLRVGVEHAKTMLNIRYDSFDAYVAKALKSSSRKKLRKNFEATAGLSDIRMSVTDDAASFVDELYPLYLQVFERSRMQFEKLTKDFFRQIGQRMNDKVRFFAWRRGNMLVAFSLCMVQGDLLYAEYVGFDYAVALDLHLYHYVVRDMINWGISKGYKWFRSSGLNYDPKLHMRHRLDPIDLYVRHTSHPCKCSIQADAALDRSSTLRRDTEAVCKLQGPLVTILLPAIEFSDSL